MKQTKLLLATAIIILGITSCKKDDAPAPAVPPVTTGLYILSEGSFSSNSTTLTYYKFSNSTAITDFWQNVNGFNLGNTGNDILLYGGKIYIVVNVTSTVEVANASTAQELKKIPFEVTPGGAKRQPRYVVGYQNKVLVSSYDGTVAVIDTTSLAIEKFITVGKNPEQMAISGTNLYVANSGGFSATFDNTVSVINLTTMTETQKITVGINPGSVAADDAGNIYVGCMGDYGAAGPKLVKISTATNTVVKSADTAVGKIRFYGGRLYATGGYLGSSKLRSLSTTDFSQAGANFVTDGTTVMNPYGVNVDGTNGDVYITDAKNFSSAGEVFCFDKTGKKKFSFSVAPGANPNTVAFIRQ